MVSVPKVQDTREATKRQRQREGMERDCVCLSRVSFVSGDTCIDILILDHDIGYGFPSAASWTTYRYGRNFNHFKRHERHDVSQAFGLWGKQSSGFMQLHHGDSLNVAKSPQVEPSGS